MALRQGAFDSGTGIMQLTSLEAVLAFGAVSTVAEEYVSRVGVVGNAWLLGSETPQFDKLCGLVGALGGKSSQLCF